MRIEKPYFEITFTASGSGTVKHMIQRDSEEAALDRLKAAYPGQTLTILNIEKSVLLHDTRTVGRTPVRGAPKK